MVHPTDFLNATFGFLIIIGVVQMSLGIWALKKYKSAWSTQNDIFKIGNKDSSILSIVSGIILVIGSIIGLCSHFGDNVHLLLIFVVFGIGLCLSLGSLISAIYNTRHYPNLNSDATSREDTIVAISGFALMMSIFAEILIALSCR